MRILRILAGAIVGYAFSALTSIAWFRFTGHPLVGPSSPAFIIATAVLGILFALAAGYLATRIAASPAGAYGVALLLVSVSILSVFADMANSLSLRDAWPLVVAVVLIAPAAALAPKLVKSRP